MGENHLPVLIAGDVHGDLERLFAALEPYPATDWRTVFLGDLVDYGMFGVGALRYARDRANTEVLLGNHEVAMLWALRDPARMGFWMSVGGQAHDLDELRKDEPLQRWMRSRPALMRLPDGALLQHCGNDDLLELVDIAEPDMVAAINERVHELLHGGGESTLWNVLSGRNVFAAQAERLDRWLELTGARRTVFGHTPHRSPRPERYHDGRAINYDGGLSRAHRLHRRGSAVGATVAPLD
ncbi:MAG TPA: metallophosphoesterase [Candidatus Dormibacteraeota bacterium]|nr:metallophosphoesterase [Candidatus Dormibacteraeota bacterium]